MDYRGNVIAMINTLIDIVKQLSDCQVMPIIGFPDLQSGHILPDDLKTFYNECGGMDLFINNVYSFRISSPQNLVLANDVLFQGVSPEDLEESKGHISWSWYIIAQHQNSIYITIDLAKERLGLCYNSEWVLHPGNSYIIAKSFTQLLEIMIKAKGEKEFWYTKLDDN